MPDTTLKKLGRNALIGFLSSVVSDSVSNSLRVIKTTRQTFPNPISYPNVVSFLFTLSILDNLLVGSKAGTGNYIRPRATLRLNMYLAGQISGQKLKLKLKFCPSRDGCYPSCSTAKVSKLNLDLISTSKIKFPHFFTYIVSRWQILCKK